MATGGQNPNMAAAAGGGSGGISPSTIAGLSQGLSSATGGTPYAGFNPFMSGGGQQQGQQQQQQPAYLQGPGMNAINVPMAGNGAAAPLSAFSQAVGGLGQYMPAQPGAITGMSPAQAAQLANWQPAPTPAPPQPTVNMPALMAAAQAAAAPAPAAAAPAAPPVQYSNGPAQPLGPGQIDPGGNWDAGPTG